MHRALIPTHLCMHVCRRTLSCHFKTYMCACIFGCKQSKYLIKTVLISQKRAYVSEIFTCLIYIQVYINYTYTRDDESIFIGSRLTHYDYNYFIRTLVSLFLTQMCDGDVYGAYTISNTIFIF